MCKVNTRGLLSVPLLINTGLCGICEKGFSKSSKQTRWKGNDGTQMDVSQLQENIVAISGTDKTSVWRGAMKEPGRIKLVK